MRRFKIAPGDSVTLQWDLQNITDRAPTPWGGAVGTSGSKNVGPVEQSTTYTIQCFNAYDSSGDTISDWVTVTVSPLAGSIGQFITYYAKQFGQFVLSIFLGSSASQSSPTNNAPAKKESAARAVPAPQPTVTCTSQAGSTKTVPVNGHQCVSDHAFITALAPSGESTWVIELNEDGTAVKQLNCFDQPQDASITPLDSSGNSTCQTYAPGSYRDAGIGRYLVQCTTSALPDSLCLATSSSPVATCPSGYVLNGSQCIPLATGPSATLKVATTALR